MKQRKPPKWLAILVTTGGNRARSRGTVATSVTRMGGEKLLSLRTWENENCIYRNDFNQTKKNMISIDFFPMKLFVLYIVSFDSNYMYIVFDRK